MGELVNQFVNIYPSLQTSSRDISKGPAVILTGKSFQSGKRLELVWNLENSWRVKSYFIDGSNDGSNDGLGATSCTPS